MGVPSVENGRVDEVPIFVARGIGVADILRGFGTWGRDVAASGAVGDEGVAGLAVVRGGLDHVRPSGRLHENRRGALRGGDGHCRGFPFVEAGIFFQKGVNLGAGGGIQMLVRDIGHHFVALSIPCRRGTCENESKHNRQKNFHGFYHLDLHQGGIVAQWEVVREFT